MLFAMWELIKSNQRKSVILLMGLALCLVLLGYFIGAAFFPPDGGVFGVFAAFSIWLVMSLVSFLSADTIFLRISQAKEVTYDVHPQLFNIVEEMKIAANLPNIPKIYIIHSDTPNAFATGLNPEKSSIAVTSGLLAKLSRDELQGVVAHEMSHILNRDVRFVTLAGVLLGSITIISEVFLRGLFYSSSSSRRYSSRDSSGGGGQLQLVMMVIAILVAILAPICAQIFYFSISRKREYLADASAVRLTRYPEGLASALARISAWPYALKTANKISAPMYIVNPFHQQKKISSNLFDTHPPVKERISVLRNMAGGANYSNYLDSYQKVRGVKEALIPRSGLQDTASIPIREASVDLSNGIEKSTQEIFREGGDVFRAASGFMFTSCVCGLKMKFPPNFKKPHINCPRCQGNIDVPVEDMAIMGAVAETLKVSQKAQEVSKQKQSQEKQTFVKKAPGWASMRCRCGHLMQVSPAFIGTKMLCPKCNDTIQVNV